MSAFLHNIARRAAGLPAESAITPSLPPAIVLETPMPAEPVAVAPVTGAVAPGRGAMASAAANPVPQMQRQAEAVPAPSVPTSPATGPPPLPASLIASAPIIVPAPAGPAAPLALPGSAPTRLDAPRPASAPVIFTEEKTIEHVRFVERPAEATPPGGTVAPVEPAVLRAASAPPQEDGRERAGSPPVPAEQSARATVFQEIIERIYASEPAGRSFAPLPAAAPAANGQWSVAGEHAPEFRTETPQPKLERHEATMATPAIPGETKSVNVRIGTLELKLSQAPAPVATAPEATSGFDAFEAIRNYRF